MGKDNIDKEFSKCVLQRHIKSSVQLGAVVLFCFYGTRLGKIEFSIQNPKFEVYRDRAKKFRFRLISSNGKCIGHSEGYNTLAACKNGIASVKKNAASPIVNEKDLEKKAVAKKVKIFFIIEKFKKLIWVN